MQVKGISKHAAKAITIIIVGVALLILGTLLSATGHISVFSRVCMLCGMLTEMVGLFIVMRKILKNKFR